MPDLSHVVARVIRRSNREHPADSVLRSELREARRLTPAQRTEISRSVFDYYRWFGWLDQRAPLRDQIAHAAALAGRGPEKIRDEELIARSVPKWLSQTMEVTAAFARALQTRPKLWLRTRKGQAEELARKLGHCRPSPVPDALEYTGSEDLFHRPEFRSGGFEIQDINSQVVTRIANPKPGETWWDACAGEGGKTLHLSDLMDNKGLIWASDRAEWRLEKLKRRAARAGVFNYRTKVWEGGERLPTKTKFDGVLIDAPCSGIGTWHRNPHARWTTRIEDVSELAQIQKDLLRNASTAVKSGGRLIYAVCTLARAETADVAVWVSEALPDFEPVSAQVLRLEDTGGNGMFVAEWKRR